MVRLLTHIRAAARLVPRPFLLLLVVAGIGYGGFRAVQSARFEYHYRQAGRAHDREAFEEAGAHLGECIRIDPNSGRALFLAARVSRRSGLFDLAGEQLAAAADLGWPAAAVELERVMLDAQRGSFDPSAEWLLRGHLANDNPDRHLALEALAQVYIRGYRLTPAKTCLDEWVAARPDSAAARMKRGWVLERMGQVEDAERDYAEVLDRHPGHRPAGVRLAQTQTLRGKFREAVPLLERLRADSPDPAVDLALARCYAGLGRTDDAQRLLAGLSGQRPRDPQIPLELGKLAVANGRLDEARTWFEKAIGLAPEEYEPHYQMCLCLKHLGDDPGAAREEKRFKEIEADLRRMAGLTEALQARPDDTDVRVQIAEIFFRRGEGSEGALWLEHVLRLDPTHRKARGLLAAYYDRIARPDLARDHRQSAGPTDP